MNSKIVSGAAEAAEKPEAASGAAAESETEITGNFRGYWRDAPMYDESGHAVVDAAGDPVTCRQFGISRILSFRGKIAQQKALISEAEIEEHNLEEGVRYNLTIQTGGMCLLKSGDARYADEYLLTNAKIISVNYRAERNWD